MKNKQQISLILLFVILIIAAFLRLYRIEDYMGFLGDEGRDALVVKRMIVDHKLTLLGPITSVGLMHLGPMYYYFMVPFLWAWNLNPVGPAIMVALFSLATILLIWQAGREFIGTRAGLIAALLYALSPLVITYSHSSWNPNILPFFSLVIIYSLLKVLVQQKYRWLLIAGLALGVAIQLHYVALVFFPIIFVMLLLKKFRFPFQYLLLGVVGLIITYAPFILFELRHDFINTKTVFEFVTRSGDGQSFTTQSFLSQFWDLTVRLFWRLIVISSAELAIIFLIFVLSVCGSVFASVRKNVTQRTVLAVLGIWFFVGLAMLALYTGSVYDYYLMFAFPLPFLLTGIALASVSRRKFGAIIVLLVLLFLTQTHVKATPILKTPNRLAALTKEISDFVLVQAAGQPFNFGLIAAGNSDHAYRYFMETGGNSPVIIENEAIDPERKTTTDQLFVVCEETVCQPLGHPVWEIAGYGRAEIAAEWSVGLFKVFKLVPYKGE